MIKLKKTRDLTSVIINGLENWLSLNILKKLGIEAIPMT